MMVWLTVIHFPQMVNLLPIVAIQALKTAAFSVLRQKCME